MERLGMVGIYKEASRLLREHRRLFTPFVLAFYLPYSLLAVFEGVFLTPASTLLFNAFISSTAHEGAGKYHTDKGQLSPTLVFSLFTLGVIISALGLASIARVVDHIYGGGDADDASIVRNVFKELPHAYLRILVTQLWFLLVLYLLLVTCFLVATILNATFAGDPTDVTLTALLFLICMVVAVVMFALAIPVAVLEPEKYGRKALRQSARYVKGRAWTVFRILSSASVFGQWIGIGPARAVAEADVPLWVKVALAVALSCFATVMFAFLGITQVLTYFVCKASAEAGLLEIQRDGATPTDETPLLSGRKSATEQRSGVDA